MHAGLQTLLLGLLFFMVSDGWCPSGLSPRLPSLLILYVISCIPHFKYHVSPQFISLPWSLPWAPGSYPSAYPTSLFRSPISISKLAYVQRDAWTLFPRQAPASSSSSLSGPLSCSGQNLEVVFDFSLCFLTHIQSIGGLRRLPFKIYPFAAIAPTATLV